MRKRLLLVLAPALVAVAQAQTTTTLYRSVGPDGKVSFSDRPNPQAREQKQLRVTTLPGSELSPETLAFIEEMKTASKDRSAPVPSKGVVIYTATWCGYCRRALAFLNANGIAYQNWDIDTPEGAASFARVGGRRGVPALFVDGERLNGYTTEAYTEIFSQRRAAQGKTAPPR
jgi:glutaredoxin